jgi:hypothetical protein
LPAAVVAFVVKDRVAAVGHSIEGGSLPHIAMEAALRAASDPAFPTIVAQVNRLISSLSAR